MSKEEPRLLRADRRGRLRIAVDQLFMAAPEHGSWRMHVLAAALLTLAMCLGAFLLLIWSELQPRR